MSHQKFHIASDSEQLARQLAQDVARTLNAAIENRGQAILVVSGGSTPKPFFALLSEFDLAWDKVLVTLADERCVEPDDAQSNAKLVRENLLQNKAAVATFLPLFEGGNADQAAADSASVRFSDLPLYDVVILGMGGDGHTASIFPEATNRADALDGGQSKSALLIDPVTVTPLRITQTANRLMSTRYLALHITGQEKAELLGKILSSPDSRQWPISHFVEQEKAPIHIYSDAKING